MSHCLYFRRLLIITAASYPPSSFPSSSSSSFFSSFPLPHSSPSFPSSFLSSFCPFLFFSFFLSTPSSLPLLHFLVPLLLFLLSLSFPPLFLITSEQCVVHDFFFWPNVWLFTDETFIISPVFCLSTAAVSFSLEEQAIRFARGANGCLALAPSSVWSFHCLKLYLHLSLSLSVSPRSFRLAWIAWFSQTLVWLVRSHPASSSFSCQSCDTCCGFVCCGSHLCCEITEIKYLSRRYFSSFLCVLYHS